MEYSQSFFISANESNPEGELAVNILVSNIIEIATAHANSLGIGNPSMEHLGAGWVLSRLTIDMTSYPKCNTQYTLTTWVEAFNRHFSTRCFSVKDESGKILGYARSVWMVLDLKTHENFGLSHLSLPEEAISGDVCPIEPQAKHVEILPYSTAPSDSSAKAITATVPENLYSFKYNDIDFYRHVNTVRYVTLLLNQYSLGDFDSHFVKRLELSFLHEGSFGDTVEIRRHDYNAGNAAFSLVSCEKRLPILFARMSLAER